MPTAPTPVTGATGVATGRDSDVERDGRDLVAGLRHCESTTAGDDQSAAASYQPATTAAGVTYWRVMARNATGTTTGVPSGPSPPQQHPDLAGAVAEQDVGTGGPESGQCVACRAAVFTVRGGGADIWDSPDEFRFVYQPLSGDGQIMRG